MKRVIVLGHNPFRPGDAVQISEDLSSLINLEFVQSFALNRQERRQLKSLNDIAPGAYGLIIESPIAVNNCRVLFDDKIFEVRYDFLEIVQFANTEE